MIYLIFLSEKDYVLILANEYDHCSYSVHKMLKSNGKNVLLIPEREFSSTRFNLELTNMVSGYLQYGSFLLNFGDLSAVLMRYIGPWYNLEDIAAEDQEYVSSELRAGFLAWLQSLRCPVINRPSPQTLLGGYSLGFYLSSIINQTGLKTPKILITNNYQKALNFHKICGYKTIYSPILAASKYFLKDDEINKIKPIINVMPVSLFENLEGDKIEVFVIGKKIFAKTENDKSIALPRNVEKKIIKLNQKLGLFFSQLQLLRKKSDFYCLGVENYPRYFRCNEDLMSKITWELTKVLMQEGGSV
jgi:hypothetical protein